MVRRTRAELEAENLVLYRELETIRDRLDELLEDDEALDDVEPAEDEADDRDRDDDEEPDAEDEN
jgi:hypothetical protein